MTETLEFLSQGGKMGALTRSYDWSSSPLGPPYQWSESLKSSVGIVLNSNQPMFIWWGAELIQFYNDAYSETMGPERHPSALGQRGRECWQEIWDIIGPQIDSIMDGGPATSHDEQLVPVTRHGKRENVWWTYTYSPIRDSAGVGGVLVICKEVTKEHLHKEELRCLNQQLSEEITQRRHESERLRVLFQQAPGFMAILRGPEHVFDFTNDAYIRLVGERDLLGKTVREALPEVTGQGFFELLDKVYETRQPFYANEIPLSIQRSVGAPLSKVFIDFVYQPIVDADGAVSGIFVEGSDVTERRLAQAALHVSQERLKEGMIAANMAVWDWDLITNEVVFSDNASQIFGVDLKALAQPWLLLHPDDASVVETAHLQAISERGNYQAVVRFIHGKSDATCWVDIRGKVLCDTNGEPCAVRGVTLDVTQQKNAEEKLHEADRRKDEFLAMLAHELRNPLAPISAAAGLLKLVKMDDAHLARTGEIIGRQVQHMTSLIDDLLDVSRVTRGLIEMAKAPLDIRRIVADAVEQVSPLIQERRQHLMLQVLPELAVVLGDKKRLVQILANLLTNAAKYTHEGGNILLKTEVQHDRIILSVQDDGVGMAPELVLRVFDLFTQAERTSDRTSGGLGLGLALVKSLVELHGGKVSCTSGGLGKGSKFTLWLPRQAGQDQSVDRRRDSRNSMSIGKPLKVMVVDDNVDAAKTLAMFLEASGHHVVVEHQARRALERAQIELPDVCLLDIGLPEMDGNELARQLRAQPETANTRLIAITGYGQEQDRQNSFAAGFDHHMVKPVDVMRLSSVLAAFGKAESKLFN